MKTSIAALGTSLAPLLFVTSIATAQTGYLTSDPLNQRACYRLDRDPSRTASVVRGGNAVSTILRHGYGSDGKPAYDVELRAAYQVLFFGQQETSFKIWVPDEYFTRDFFPNLRQTRLYVARDFKMQHLGVQTIRTLDGEVYTDTDYVRIYDVNSSRYPELLAPVTNVEIYAWMKEGVPALGAARLNVSGDTLGIRIRAGVDYSRSASQCP